MNGMETPMDLRLLLFSFHGRINRAQYWLAMLMYTVVGGILGVIGQVLDDGLAYLLLAVVVELAVLISSLAVIVKRLHDRNRSAWWLLMFYLVPCVLAAIGVGVEMASGSWVVMAICSVVALAIGVWAFIEWGCLRGTVGPNRYGPDPLWPQALPAQS
jgi:uncharacterized membrane protein YhaH (DUF805 family)